MNYKDKIKNNNESKTMSRFEEAGELANTLLLEIETQEHSSEKYLMKSMRLARLLKDPDAQLWLGYEMSGYPQSFSFSKLGNCEKYARYGGRITKDDKYWLGSMPEIEAHAYVDKTSIQNSSGVTKDIAPVKNYVEAGATQQVLSQQLAAINSIKNNYRKNASLLASLKSSIHAYVSDCYLAIQLGDVAHDIFEEARIDVEKFTTYNCPKGAEKLLAVTERMKENTAESRTAALTTCRRLMMDVADSIFPAKDDSYIDSKGKNRNVSSENYKNRILAFIDKSLKSDSSEQLLIGEIDHLAARLDAVYEKNCKGVHVDISREEARLAVISTYLVIAEISRLNTNTKKN